jgi:hypothetical protein
MKANQVEIPKKTFFFERHDGTTFPVHEQEAWRIINSRNQAYFKYPNPKLIGVSDGTKYWKGVMEAHELVATDPEAAKQRLRDAHREELEAARGNIEMPRNFDIIDKNGNPTTL